MINITNFQDALAKRQQIKQDLTNANNTIRERAKIYIDHFDGMLKGTTQNDYNLTLAMFYETLHRLANHEVFASSMELMFAAAGPDINIINKEETGLVNCVRLINQAGNSKIEELSMTVLALGTKEGYKDKFDYDVETLLQDVSMTPETDLKQVQTVAYNYAYEHPDADGERDRGSNTALAYELIDTLIKKGYVLARYGYVVNYDKEKNRKMPGELLMEFVQTGNPLYEEKVYLYYDIEAAMKSIELLFDELFGEEPS